MAITNLTKGLFALVGAGTLFGLGHLAKPYIWGDRIMDLIKENNKNRKLLTSSSPSYSERWKKAWFKYREVNKGTGAWGILDSKKETSADVPAPISFMIACQTNSEVRISSTSNPLYKQVLDWCTSESAVSIKDLIKESGRRALTNKDPKDKDDLGWKPIWKKYLDAYSKKSDNPLNIEGWNGSETRPIVDSNNEIMQKFIDECVKLSNVTVTETTDPTYAKVNGHCSANIRAEDLIRDGLGKGKKLLDLNRFKAATAVANRDIENSEHNGIASVAQEIWQRYLKDGKNIWSIDYNKENQDKKIPEAFWNKCEETRKKEVKGTEDESFKQVLSYCTVKDRDSEYAEKDL